MYTKEKFLKEFQKVPVIEFDHKTSDNPLVSVCVQTYQHVSHISKCLDGILMQKTNFDFEILVGEDASSDGTRDICIEYAKKYPNKIRLFLHARENNIEVYGRPSPHFNYKYNITSARGKYLAVCEGDDYWIDPLKLQKQVDFLEANDEYGIIYSDTTFINENEEEEEKTEKLINVEKRYDRIRDKIVSGDIFWNLLEKNLINTLTVCSRTKLVLDYHTNFYEEFTYDHRLWLHLASLSKVKHVSEKWSAYRVSNQGISSNNGFFDKRTPLVKQSALVYYLSLIDYDNNRIDKKIFSKTVYQILKSKHLSTKEKKPIINLLKSKPKFLFYVFKWRLGVLLSKI